SASATGRIRAPTTARSRTAGTGMERYTAAPEREAARGGPAVRLGDWGTWESDRIHGSGSGHTMAPARDPTGETTVTPTPPITSYVAIGDSFTEGLMDVAEPAGTPHGADPAAAGAPGAQASSTHATDPHADRFRGWADRLAEQLVTSPVGSPDLTYANLAIRGRLADQVLHEQLPRALELAPDLVSICAGGNDCLRPYTNIDQLADEVEQAIIRLREAGIRVLMVNGYDTETASPLLRTVRSRVATYNSHLWTIAQRHDCRMLDLWGLRELYANEMWAEDRIHLSAQGHELV